MVFAFILSYNIFLFFPFLIDRLRLSKLSGRSEIGETDRDDFSIWCYLCWGTGADKKKIRGERSHY